MRGHSGDALAFVFLAVSGIAALVVAASLNLRDAWIVVVSLGVTGLGLALLLLLVWRNYR